MRELNAALYITDKEYLPFSSQQPAHNHVNYKTSAPEYYVDGHGYAVCKRRIVKE